MTNASINCPVENALNAKRYADKEYREAEERYLSNATDDNRRIMLNCRAALDEATRRWRDITADPMPY